MVISKKALLGEKTKVDIHGEEFEMYPLPSDAFILLSEHVEEVKKFQDILDKILKDMRYLSADDIKDEDMKIFSERLSCDVPKSLVKKISEQKLEIAAKMAIRNSEFESVEEFMKEGNIELTNIMYRLAFEVNGYVDPKLEEAEKLLKGDSKSSN